MQKSKSKLTPIKMLSERGQGGIEFILGLVILILIILGLVWAISKLIQLITPILGKVDTEQVIVVVISALVSVLSGILLNVLKPLFSILVTRIQKYVQNKIAEVSPRLTTLREKISGFFNKPKWYKTPNAIEPGLIEVSIAVTAVLVALPVPEVSVMKVLKLTSEIISIIISIGMLNRYAQSKGSTTHILINPFENGPVFFLGWSILFALIFLGLVF